MNHQMETSALVDGPLKSVLSITFSGPYLYDFRGGLKVDIYAPYCPLHEGGFFYSDNSRSETDLWACAQAGGTYLNSSDRAYVITGSGIQMNPWPPTIIRQVELPHTRRKEVSFLGTTKSQPCAPRFDKMLFKLSVPVPAYVCPLYTDLVEVLDGYDTPPAQKYKHYATGLRFFYGWDASQDPSPSPCADIGEPSNVAVEHTGGDCHAPIIALGLEGV
jgi:hypothetical protein